MNKPDSALPPVEEKAAYVERMFGRIAPRYDRMNRLMTFGLDVGWRAELVQTLAPPADARALDVGTGTGDFLPLLAARVPAGLVVGTDFSLPMMQAGIPKLASLDVPGGFVGGDALRLPFADNTFDVVTTGFTLRNVVDIAQALREIYRVTRPGGRMANLEVARPASPLLRWGHRAYFEGVVPLLGALAGGDLSAYRYLPRSARAFPPPPQLSALMEQAGWAEVAYRLYGLGAVAVHVGQKPFVA